MVSFQLAWCHFSLRGVISACVVSFQLSGCKFPLAGCHFSLHGLNSACMDMQKELVSTKKGFVRGAEIETGTTTECTPRLETRPNGKAEREF